MAGGRSLSPDRAAARAMPPWIRILARRAGAAVVVVAGALSLAFFALDALPGAGERPDRDPRVGLEQRQRLRAIYGLDDPAWRRAARWMAAATRGDLGLSLSRQRPVSDLLRAAAAPTLMLAAAALALELAAGVALGGWAARRPGGWIDRLIGWIAVVLYSLPTFWVALVALLAFVVEWPVFPASFAADRGPGDLLRSLALPAAVLAATGIGAVARFTRDGMVEALEQDWVRAERARGIVESVVFRHAFQASAGPLVQWVGIELPRLVSGALVVEVVFAWPGLGRLAYDGVLGRDLPLVLGTTAATALLVLVASWGADLVHAAIDPRVRRPVADPWAPR